MDRTRFLKTFTMLAAGSVLGQRLATAGTVKAVLGDQGKPAGTPERRFRGTTEGEILVTEDGGGTWKQHARFGSDCAVLNINQNATDITAYLRGQGGEFTLRLSPDGKYWVSI